MASSKSAGDLSAFFDANIFMDILFTRSKWQNSAKAINAAKTNKIQKGCASSLTVAIIYFLRRGSKGSRQVTDAQARSDVQNSISGLQVLAISSNNISSAIGDKRFRDFEDAMQFHCARDAGADVIVTRNKKDFSKVANEIEILNPEEFLNKYGI
jgi:predicted nucleic acid-binding protein